MWFGIWSDPLFVALHILGGHLGCAKTSAIYELTLVNSLQYERA